jgi:riboflavin biosynthesis pyrimidine reductase
MSSGESEGVSAAIGAMSDSMFAECMETGQAARVVPDDESAESIRQLLRATAKDAGVGIRTARTDDTVVVVRVDADVWDDDAATMREKLTPAERR